MGKMAYKEAKELLDAGAITEEKLREWIDSGWVTKPAKEKLFYLMEDDNGTLVSLKYNFSAHQPTTKGFRTKLTTDMVKMCEEIDSIIYKYATHIDSGTEVELLTKDN